MAAAVVLTAACRSDPTATPAPPASSSTTGTPTTTSSPGTSPGTPDGTSPTTTPVDTATTTTVAPPPTSRTGDNGTGEGEGNAIRKVDFANFTYPSDACGTTYAEPPSGGFSLANGEVAHGTPRDADFYSVALHPDIAYGDVTGDGNDEAAILLDCNSGNRPDVFGWLYTLGASGPTALATVSFGSDNLQAASASQAQLLDVRISERRVDSRWGLVVAGDAPCCPSKQATLVSRWTGSALVSDGPPKVTGA
jgi:hypothetical protein